MKESILSSLTSSPRVVERILRVYPTDRLDDRIGEARFTPREAIASLADMEQIVLDRVRMAHLQPGSSVESIDAGHRAEEHHYFDKNVFHEAEVFESRRATTVEFLRCLSDDDWLKSFVLSGEKTTIRDYVALVLANDMFHLDQLSCHLANEAATIC